MANCIGRAGTVDSLCALGQCCSTRLEHQRYELTCDPQVRQICRGLEYLKSQNVVHGDLRGVGGYIHKFLMVVDRTSSFERAGKCSRRCQSRYTLVRFWRLAVGRHGHGERGGLLS